MFSNYIKIAWRNLTRHRAYSFVNIFGLATAIACCLLIVLHVQDELRFDGFHGKADRIFRVVEKRISPEQGARQVAYTMPPLAEALKNDFAEVEDAVRLFQGWRLTAGDSDERLIVRKYFFTDNSFFNIFDFKLLHGEASRAFAEPGSVVLTRTSAQKLYGAKNPVGQTLKLDAEDFPEFGETEFRVTGVVENAPHNSHIDFRLLISMNTLQRFENVSQWLQNWDFGFAVTYVLLRDEAAADELQAKFPAFSVKYRGDEAWQNRQFYLQPLSEVHFYSDDIQFEHNTREGSLIYVYVFAIIAAFIVIIAAINYINLATARSVNRAKEVGLRKVVGAFRGQLVWQFLGESLLTCFIALMVAVGLVQLILPQFNVLAEKQLSLNLIDSTPVLLVLAGVVTLIGLVSGSYPAFYLSRFKPAVVLKGTSAAGGRSVLRQVLVVTQFALSIVMIAATLIVYDQLNYVQTKDLGFNHERLLVIDINHDDVQSNFRTIKTEFARAAAVQNVTVSSRVPGDWKPFRQVEAVKEGAAAADVQSLYFNGIDEDFLPTYNIKLIAGRNFKPELASDSTAMLINETAAGQLYADSPLGKRLRFPDYEFEGHIVGVVQDFHFHSLHEQLSPLVMGFMRNSGSHPLHGIDYFTLRVRSENEAAVIEHVKSVHERFDPANPVEYAFLDTWLTELYETDERVGKIFGASAALAILVACVGLFGLAAFLAEQRTREIGIRKTFGASLADIVGLLSRNYAKLVVIALVVAAPVTYLAMQQWLAGFAYRIDVGVGPFLLAGIISLAVAFVTVSCQSIKAGLTNPAEALRHE